MGLVDEVGTGDRRRSLIAIRDKLAAELELAEGRNVATIAAELTKTIRELDLLPTGKERSAVDELAKRRTTRRKKAAGL